MSSQAPVFIGRSYRSPLVVLNKLALCLLFSFCYVFIVPWAEIKGTDFTDVANYLARMQNLSQGSVFDLEFGVGFLFSEWLWKLLLYSVTIIFSDLEMGLLVLSFLSLFLYLMFFTRHLSLLLVLFFTTNPMFIDLIMSQVRIALAFSVFLFCLDSKNGITKAFLIVTAFFIHSAVLLFLSIIIIIRLLRLLKLSKRSLLIMSVFLGLFVSLFMEYGVVWFLSLVGDRRAEQGGFEGGSSIFYAAIWFFIATWLAIRAKAESEYETTIISFSIVMMAIFFFNSVLNVYGQRFVSVSLGIILFSIKRVRVYEQAYLFSFASVYYYFQWIYWVGND